MPLSSAIEKFQALYERHYGVMLLPADAEEKLSALLGFLAAARTCAHAPERGGFLGHDEYYRDQFIP